jgi:pyruvate formate lyase activating enzyme
VSVLVEHIQRFSLHDGPGIRTTVFLKGCSLHCPWCANPENLNAQKEFLLQKNKCITKDHSCVIYPDCAAAKDIRRTFTQEDAKKCSIGAIRLSGTDWGTDALAEELCKDREYFYPDGGITFSGGEPLLWADELSPLWDKIRGKGIDLCCETSLFVPEQNAALAVSKVNRFIVDVKSLDSQICQNVLGGDLPLFLNNYKMLFQQKVPIVLRFPLVPNITATEDNVNKVAEFIRKYPPEKVEMFSVHNLAEHKYYAIGKEYQHFDVLSEDALNRIKCILSASACSVEICQL